MYKFVGGDCRTHCGVTDHSSTCSSWKTTLCPYSFFSQCCFIYKYLYTVMYFAGIMPLHFLSNVFNTHSLTTTLFLFCNSTCFHRTTEHTENHFLFSFFQYSMRSNFMYIFCSRPNYFQVFTIIFYISTQNKLSIFLCTIYFCHIFLQSAG